MEEIGKTDSRKRSCPFCWAQEGDKYKTGLLRDGLLGMSYKTTLGWEGSVVSVYWKQLQQSAVQLHIAADQYISNYYLSGWLSSTAFKT